MFDIITIGSATRDVFVRSAGMEIKKDPRAKTGRAICFPLGSKMAVDEMHFEVGGNAMNAGVTFARQGYSVGLAALFGDDPGGGAIREEAKRHNIDCMVKPSKNGHTAYSILLSARNGERTILEYRGIGEHLRKSDIPWGAIVKTKWWYMSHLAGESSKQFVPLLRYAAKHTISIAFNPGKTQLMLGKKLVPLLKNVKVLVLNREEASYLTGVPYAKEEKIFETLDTLVSGVVVMTEGREGVKVSDGTHRWKAGILKERKLVDRTGAGDAFGSGFVSAIMRGRSIEDAIQTGSANATGCIGEWGASKGLLGRRDSIYKFGKLKIEKRKIV